MPLDHFILSYFNCNIVKPLTVEKSAPGSLQIIDTNSVFETLLQVKSLSGGSLLLHQAPDTLSAVQKPKWCSIKCPEIDTAPCAETFLIPFSIHTFKIHPTPTLHFLPNSMPAVISDKDYKFL